MNKLVKRGVDAVVPGKALLKQCKYRGYSAGYVGVKDDYIRVPRYRAYTYAQNVREGRS